MDVTPRDRAAMVHAYYHHIDAGDVCSALACFAQNAVYRRPGYTALEGLDSITDYYRSTRMIGQGRHDIELLIESPDEVAVRGAFRGTSHAGLPLAVRFADFWRFEQQLVVERNTYFDDAAV